LGFFFPQSRRGGAIPSAIIYYPRQILAEILAKFSLKLLAESSLKLLAEYVIEHRGIALIERVCHGSSSNITHKRGSDYARSV
jgi:hypothetical protein